MKKSVFEDQRFRQLAVFWMTALGCLMVLILRDLPGALSPPIRVEDATEMLSFYWRNPDPTQILRFYAGYTSVGPNLIGYLSGQLPATAAIYLLHWVPLVLAACTFAALQIGGVELLRMTTREKMFVALALAATPIGNWALVTNTTYMLWSMLIFSTLIVLFWKPQPGFWAVMLFALLAVFGWSHPLIILLAPALAIRIYFAATTFERMGFAFLLASALFYISFGIEWGGEEQQTNIRGLVALALESMAAFLSRAVTESLISSRLRIAVIHWDYLELTIVFGVFVLAAAVAAAWRWRRAMTRSDVQQILVLMIYAGLFTATSTASGRVVIESGWTQRYTYPSAFLLMLLVFWAVLRGIQSLPPRASFRASVMVLVWLGSINLLDRNYYRSSHIDRANTWGVVVAATENSAQGEAYCFANERPKWTLRLAENWPQEHPCTTVIVDN